MGVMQKNYEATAARGGIPADAPAKRMALITGVVGIENVRDADLVIAAVPWEGHGQLLSGLASELAGKILVDCVNPVGFDSRGAYPLPVPAGSAAEQAAALLPDTTVVAAFQHLSAVLLLDPEVETIDLDVLVLGDDRHATDLVQALAERMGAAYFPMTQMSANQLGRLVIRLRARR